MRSHQSYRAECWPGIRAFAIHGRTRQCAFRGEAEYSTIRQVKMCADIPNIANGDIIDPEQARRILEFTGAVIIGLAAQGDNSHRHR